MTRVPLLLGVLAPIVLGWAPARADCRARMEALTPRASEIKEERIRKLFEFDMQRGARELGEGDEDECAEAMDHAEKLLAGQY